jgi:hypothetical protein
MHPASKSFFVVCFGAALHGRAVRFSRGLGSNVVDKEDLLSQPTGNQWLANTYALPEVHQDAFYFTLSRFCLTICYYCGTILQVATSSVLANKLDLESFEQIISWTQTSKSFPFDTRAYRSKKQTHAVRQRRQQNVLEWWARGSAFT